MKKITPLIFLFLPVISFAQIEFGSPTAAALGGAVTATARDWAAIEINPANLGLKDSHPFSLSIANVGITIQDNGLSYSELKELQNGKLDSVTPTQRQQMYNAETAPGGLNVNATIVWAAFSFSIPKIGGFAVNLTDEVFAHAQLSPSAASAISNLLANDTAELIALAKQDPDLFTNSPTTLFSGSNAGGYHYRELNIDYGRKILTINIHSNGPGGASYENSEFQDSSKTGKNTVSNPIIIYGGIGIKPIWGLGDYSSYITGSENTEEGTYVYGNPNYGKNLFSNVFTANGRGFGVDLGLTASYKKWKLGVSAIDLGKIKWQNNTFVNTTVLFPAVDTIASIIAHSTKALNYITARGTGPDYSTQLPSKFRSGISYQLSKSIEFSGDFVAPLNTVQGNLLFPYTAAGVHIRLLHILSVSGGIGVEKEFPTVVPVGAFLNLLGNFQLFVATDDLLAYLNPDNGRVISLEFGVKLFGF